MLGQFRLANLQSAWGCPIQQTGGEDIHQRLIALETHLVLPLLHTVAFLPWLFVFFFFFFLTLSDLKNAARPGCGIHVNPLLLNVFYWWV